MVTEEYAPGRLADVHGEGGPLVLLWHGKGSDSRPEVAGLAAAIAAHAVRVVVPDWSSDAAAGGREQLLASVAFARRVGGDEPLVVAGWSLGGTAATGLTVAARSLGLRVAATVLISPADGPRVIDPISASRLPDRFPDGSTAGTVDVVCGSRDDITEPGMVRGLEARLRAAGWRTSLTELDADHGSVAMTRYDAGLDRFVAADDPATRAAGEQVAAIVAAAARTS